MRKESWDIIAGIIFIIMGVSFLTGCNYFGTKAIKFWQRFTEKDYQILYICGGICIIGIGGFLIFNFISNSNIIMLTGGIITIVIGLYLIVTSNYYGEKIVSWYNNNWAKQVIIIGYLVSGIVSIISGICILFHILPNK